MESEYYTNSADTISSEQINNKTISDFFQNTSFIGKDPQKLTEKEIDYNLHQLLKPSRESTKKQYYENVLEYIPRLTHPYEIIMKLQSNLAEVKTEIDSSAKMFKDLSSIVDINTESFASSAYDQIKKSKKTIDAFINYTLLNKGEESEENNDSDESDGQDAHYTAENNSNKKEDNKETQSISTEENPKYYSAYERYNRLSENLLSQVKQLENDLIAGNNKDSKIEYEITMNKVTEEEDLNNRLNALEDSITHIEKDVGKWDHIKNLDNLSKYITNLVYYNQELVNSSDHTKRYDTLKLMNALFSDFEKEYRRNMKIAHVYSKIIEAFRYYEFCQEYQADLSNIKIRLKAIKSVCDTSNQLKETLMLLKDQVENNETKYEELTINYTQTLTLFKVLEGLLPELEELDKAIKAKVKKSKKQ